MRRMMVIVGILVALGAVVAFAGPNDLKDEGVGTYSDASVANQISNFTINRQMISCGVGTVATPPNFSGPFAMLMYAKDIFHYDANHQTKIIRARGRMRSITHFGGVQAEDVEHDFLAIAVDNGALGDTFNIHFRTCFWNAAGGPLDPSCPDSACDPSTEVPDGCRFGGQLLTDNLGQTQMGDITVGR